jgi:hypothetical protein
MTGTCSVCGSPLAGRRADALTCSDRCRQRARRAAKAAVLAVTEPLGVTPTPGTTWTDCDDDDLDPLQHWRPSDD